MQEKMFAILDVEWEQELVKQVWNFRSIQLGAVILDERLHTFLLYGVEDGGSRGSLNFWKLSFFLFTSYDILWYTVSLGIKWKENGKKRGRIV